MSILRLSVSQINRYSFLVKDITTQERYDAVGVDLTTGVTAATLTVTNLYDNESYDIDILSDWAYLLDDGITVNMTDFPDNKLGNYAYFPDWFYRFKVTYTYNGVQYSASKEVGFRYYIKNVVFQQLQQSDWKQTIGCGCGCEKYNTSIRKFNWLKALEIASDLCLVNEFNTTLLALYKLTGYTHEFSE